MKKTGFILITTLLFLSYSGSCQDLNAVKTDADCLQFIRTYIYKDCNFSFDTIFTASELKAMNLPSRHWGKFDFNNDKKTDLFFVGRCKDRTGKYFVSALYLSDTGQYKVVGVQRSWLSYYSPLLFPVKLNNKQLLCVYRFDKGNSSRVDSLVALRSHLYPAGIRIIDTFVYKHGEVVNYSSRPARLEFDSLSVRIEYQQSCNIDSFTVYADGICKYAYLTCSEFVLERTLPFSRSNFEKVRKLIKEIDLQTTPAKYIVSETDHSSALLTIYTKNGPVTFYDYGMKSNFTLIAIYKVFLDIDPLNL